MKTKALIRLLYKKISRKYLIGNNIAGSLMSILVLFIFAYCLYSIGVAGNFILQAHPKIIPSPKMAAFYSAVGFTLDIALKYIFKNPDVYFLRLKRFPYVRKKIKTWYLINEGISFWNVYGCVLFFAPIYYHFYTSGNFKTFLCVILYIYSLQVAASLISVSMMIKNSQTILTSLFLTYASLAGIFFIFNSEIIILPYFFLVMLFPVIISIILLTKKNIHELEYSTLPHQRRFTILPFSTVRHTLLYYTLFNIRMIWRSPVLRKQLVILTLLTVTYIYIYTERSDFFVSPLIHLCITSFLFSAFPLLFSQYLISAESTFFEKLILIPKFYSYLLSKYILSILFSLLSFIFFILVASVKSYLEVTAIFLYSIGPITAGTFISMLFADRRLQLFGGILEIQRSGLSAQVWIVTFSYLLNLLITSSAYFIIGDETMFAYFMVICGFAVLVTTKKWLGFLICRFSRLKYKKMAVYRR